MKRKPSEFAVNSFASMMSIVQPDDLDFITQQNAFNELNPCHIYFICRRLRVIIEKEKFKAFDDKLEMEFKVQYKDKYKDLDIIIENPFKSKNIQLITEFPFNHFEITHGDKTLYAKTAMFLQSLPRNYFDGEFLDLEILYIGQSYGVDGARTAPDRLKSHETLQAIYTEALSKNTDQEIWLALLSFQQINISMFNGRTKFTEEEKAEDKERSKRIFLGLLDGEISEQQFINFTEAALIKYFEPQYNKEYKNIFPNPAHKTYSQCYDLDVNTVCLEIRSFESVNIFFLTKKINERIDHYAHFMIHNKNERKSMFDFLPDD